MLIKWWSRQSTFTLNLIILIQNPRQELQWTLYNQLKGDTETNYDVKTWVTNLCDLVYAQTHCIDKTNFALGNPYVFIREGGTLAALICSGPNFFVTEISALREQLIEENENMSKRIHLSKLGRAAGNHKRQLKTRGAPHFSPKDCI